MRTALYLGANRCDDGRVTMAGERDAVSAVQVDVGVPVDVIELGALAVAKPDRLRAGDLLAGDDAARQGCACQRRKSGRLELAADEDLLLVLDDLG